MALTATEEALLRDLLAKQAELIALANNETTITAKLGSTKATIDDLTAATTVADSDLMIVRQNGVDKKLPVSVVKSDLVDLSSYAPLASPALTGTPTAPTAAASTNTTQVATTAYAMTAAANAVAGVATTFASSAENAAGTVENKAVDPLGIREAFNATGSAPVFACRAWVNFNGTGTVAIRASGNVSSITDNGTGNYTVNFTTAMPDADYSVAGMAGDTSSGDGRIATQYLTQTESAFHFRVRSGNNALMDPDQCSIAIFR